MRNSNNPLVDDESLETSPESTSSNNENEIKKIEDLARRETKRINFTRGVVLTLLIASGVAVTGLTYHFLSGEERRQYESNYYHFVDTMRDQSNFYQQKLHEAFRSMATTITAAAQHNGETFPFVTVPMFEVHARATCRHSAAEALVFLPIVETNQLEAWERYSVQNQWWTEESRDAYWAMGREVFASIETQFGRDTYANLTIPEHLFALDFTLPPPFLTSVNEQGPYLPFWQASPPGFDNQFTNYDRYSDPTHKAPIDAAFAAREGIFTSVIPMGFLATSSHGGEPHVQFHQQFTTIELNESSAFMSPHSFLTEPIFDTLDGAKNPNAKVVGYLQGIVAWDRYLGNLLPDGVKGIYCVLKNSCGQSYTLVVDGKYAQYIGEGDFHDTDFDDTEVIIPLADYIHPNATPGVEGHCEYYYYVYASQEYETSSCTNLPLIFTCLVAGIFAIMIITFILYDRFVKQRNNIVIDAAARLNQILGSLFPANIRDQLFKSSGSSKDDLSERPRNRLRNFLDADILGIGDDSQSSRRDKPIADLFTETTIIFADIAGFTAWSSTRQPPQVFTFLETVYHRFDTIAKHRGVFKVETVGDCYVAVCGLPDARRDHAVVMARFARDIMRSMEFVTKKMEVSLGPDTGDLTLRIGLHSGPVTAGVLRGDRARFQLFGDTMNTASRMESTGEAGRVQISQECADLLLDAGKHWWVTQRKDKIIAKGKGELVTYWLERSGAKRRWGSNDGSHCSSSGGSLHGEELDWGDDIQDKQSRLVEWNVECLSLILKHIIARRNAAQFIRTSAIRASTKVVDHSSIVSDGTVLEEVKEIITLPKFNAKAARHEDPMGVDLSQVVWEQLRDYVNNIAMMYRDNPFHNFEHASHVALSVNKLLSRIVAPDEVENDQSKSLHDHTYGITSDPLTQFACVFSALIHDVDHTGVPNAQLVKENAAIADHYKGKSVAEQNSVDLAWNLLMQDQYAELRGTIYKTESELKRFRQLVVNSVMATDIVDKELKALRNDRWDKAFTEVTDEGTSDAINRKATIVIEHIIQASDVSHTMQHWHVYRKWNENFFMECYNAYLDGRAENDPSLSWYQGEMGFFDFYIIPLAKKLKDCGVFGVSSDEYLNYAKQNRKEWEAKGEEVVNELREKVRGVVMA